MQGRVLGNSGHWGWEWEWCREGGGRGLAQLQNPEALSPRYTVENELSERGCERYRDGCKPGDQAGCGYCSQAAGASCLCFGGWHFILGKDFLEGQSIQTQPNGLCPRLGLGTRKDAQQDAQRRQQCQQAARIQGLSRAWFGGQIKAWAYPSLPGLRGFTWQAEQTAQSSWWSH